MIPWREKFRAFGIHFATTLVVAAAAAALIFLVWYPPPFGTMVGGLKLFALITGIDLALGPLGSLVVYDSRKSRRALIFDYSVIAILQIAALVYGIYSVSQNRPAYVAFVKDRIEVIAAGEIAEQDWLEAKDSSYGTPPWRGPKLVATYVRPADSNDALDGGLEGRDVGVRPKFYVEYDTQVDTIKHHVKPLSATGATPSGICPIDSREPARASAAGRRSRLAPRQALARLLDCAGRPAQWLSGEVPADRPVLIERLDYFLRAGALAFDLAGALTLVFALDFAGPWLCGPTSWPAPSPCAQRLSTSP